jgi:flagellin-like protein
MYTRKNDEAVSPIIGVILMVAITVILAAIIAAFVFGMSGNINKSKIVAVSAQQIDSTHITVTYLGGQDSGSLELAMVNVTDDDGKFVKVDNLTNVVGNSVKATGKFSNNNHVVVVGHFVDNSDQVLLDTQV